MDIPQGPIELPDYSYAELPAPNAVDEQTIAQLDANIKHANWVQTHFCITEIRKINKFHPDFTNDIVQRYSNAFVDLFATGKTQVIKNMLRMVNEIFDMGQQINVEKAVYTFLPIILKKASTDLGHIKEMSQLILTSFAMNCGYDISFKSNSHLIQWPPASQSTKTSPSPNSPSSFSLNSSRESATRLGSSTPRPLS